MHRYGLVCYLSPLTLPWAIGKVRPRRPERAGEGIREGAGSNAVSSSGRTARELRPERCRRHPELQTGTPPADEGLLVRAGQHRFDSGTAVVLARP